MKDSQVASACHLYYNSIYNNITIFFNAFQLLDEKKLKEVDNLYHEFETPEKASKM